MKRYGLLSVLFAVVLSACGGSIKSPDFESDLTDITITPNPASIGTGETLQFTANGTYSAPSGQGSSSRDITDEVDWQSSNLAVATIDESGLVTGVGKGSTTITASKDGEKASVTLTGEGVVLRTVVVTTPRPGVAPGGETTYTAQGIYSNSPTPRDIVDSEITWTVDPSSLGTLAPAAGKTVTVTGGATAGTGKVVAKAVAYNLTGSAPFGVGILGSVSVTPATAAEAVGLPVSFKAVGTYGLTTGSSDTFTLDVPATWQAANDSSSPTGALPPSLDSACAGGLAAALCKITGNTEGALVKITTSYNGFSGAATLTVGPAKLFKVEITPDAPAAAIRGTPATVPVSLGEAKKLYALYFYSDAQSTPAATPRDPAEAVAWSADSSTSIGVQVSPLDNSATVIGKAANTSANVKAAVSNGPSDSVRIDVGAATLKQLTGVTPSKAYVSVGRAQEFTAVGTFTDGAANVGIPDDQVNWSSNKLSTATIDANGVATAGNAPDPVGATITATLKADTTQRATAQMVATASGCATPLLAADGALASEGPKAGICLLCGVSNPAAITDPDPASFAAINVGVGALDASRSIDVNASTSAPYTVPFAAGSRPAFIIGRPNGPLLLAEVLSQLEINTLLNGAVQESSKELVGLRLDLLGIDLINTSQNTGLLSMRTTLPYDGIRVRLKSGLATALGRVTVFQACGTSFTPVTAGSGISSLQAVNGSNDSVPQLEVGANLGFIAHDYADSDLELNAEDVDWTSSDDSKAAVSATGIVTGVAPGTVTITGKLKNSNSCGANCSAVRQVKVVEPVCAEPLQASLGATITGDSSGLCAFCSTVDLPNAIDGIASTYGTAFLPAALLGASVTVTASAGPPYALPFKAGQTAGFVVGSPVGKLATVGLASSIVVETLRNGQPTGDSSNTRTPLRLDLLGIAVTGSNNARPLFIDTTADYDALRVTFKGGVATALSSYSVYGACANASATASTPSP